MWMQIPSPQALEFNEQGSLCVRVSFQQGPAWSSWVPVPCSTSSSPASVSVSDATVKSLACEGPPDRQGADVAIAKATCVASTSAGSNENEFALNAQVGTSNSDITASIPLSQLVRSRQDDRLTKESGISPKSGSHNQSSNSKNMHQHVPGPPLDDGDQQKQPHKANDGASLENERQFREIRGQVEATQQDPDIPVNTPPRTLKKAPRLSQQERWQTQRYEEASTFMDAVCMGDVDCVRNMLLGTASLATARDPEEDGDFTALFFAATAGHADICDILMQFGANVSQVSSTDGSTPLCCAVAHGHYAACQVLIEAKSDVNHMVTPREEADSNAAQNGTEQGSDAAFAQTLLGLAVDSGNAHIVELLLGSKAIVDSPDSSGATPLYVTVVFEELNHDFSIRS